MIYLLDEQYKKVDLNVCEEGLFCLSEFKDVNTNNSGMLKFLLSSMTVKET